MQQGGRTVAIDTFGCKLNQAESAMLAEMFLQRGWRVVPSDAPADVYVMNSCAVTARSEAKLRQRIRQLVRRNRQARIAVVGCASQLRPESLRELPNVRWVLGSDGKFDLVARIADGEPEETEPREGGSLAPVPGRFEPRSRAFLKIQDGCRFRCSYCTVPLARGKSRSVAPEAVLEHARILAGRGYRELVLTGVDIGSYGLDLQPRRSLGWLLGELLRSVPAVRIRLSSVEPVEVQDELIDVVARSPRICAHWHIPLQSGSDRVLRAMGRPYSRQQYLAQVRALLARCGRIGLGTDVIVGFPGESEADFEATVKLVEEVPYTYLHVFPYSPRPGTASWSLPDDVPRAEKQRRSRVLRELAARKKQDFLNTFLGQQVEVLVEARSRGDRLTGLTEHYVRVCFEGAADLENRLVKVCIESVGDGVLMGTVVSGGREPAQTLSFRSADVRDIRAATCCNA